MTRVCANCRFARIDIRPEKPCYVCVKKGSVVTNIYARKNCDDMWKEQNNDKSKSDRVIEQ